VARAPTESQREVRRCMIAPWWMLAACGDVVVDLLIVQISPSEAVI